MNPLQKLKRKRKSSKVNTREPSRDPEWLPAFTEDEFPHPDWTMRFLAVLVAWLGWLST